MDLDVGTLILIIGLVLGGGFLGSWVGHQLYQKTRSIPPQPGNSTEEHVLSPIPRILRPRMIGAVIGAAMAGAGVISPVIFLLGIILLGDYFLGLDASRLRSARIKRRE